jgi:hypothetical protein
MATIEVGSQGERRVVTDEELLALYLSQSTERNN